MARLRSKGTVKILACSDMRNWDRFHALVETAKPKIVILGGDLVCDGGVTHDPDQRAAIGHVRKFYDAIRYAGQRSKVLVIKGNHEECFEGDYQPERINATLGCAEISGKLCEAEGLKILGISFEQSHRLSALRPLVATYTKKVDIVVAHCEQNRLQMVAELRPQLIVRGHFGVGTFVVNGVPTVQPNGVDCVQVEFEAGRLRGITELPKPRPTLLQVQMRRWAWLETYNEFS